MRVLIISAQEDFRFPLAEAGRKQIFAEAVRLQTEGMEVKIMIVTPRSREKIIHDGIPITLVRKVDLLRRVGYLRGFDSLHFWGTTGVVALMVGLLGRPVPRLFTVTDGGVLSIGSRAWLRKILARLMPYFYERFDVFTRYQERVLSRISARYQSRVEMRLPVLSRVQRPRREKAARPTMLYMGHLSRFKGVDIVVRVFENLLPEFPDLQLVIADNGLVYDDSGRASVIELRDRFPQHVSIKGRVDPYEELSRAHLLIYPVRRHSGTFAFPLSLFESLQCGTPFLSTRLDGFLEFFDEYFLCEKGDTKDFSARAKEILTSPEQAEQDVAHNLERFSDLTATVIRERAL